MITIVIPWQMDNVVKPKAWLFTDSMGGISTAPWHGLSTVPVITVGMLYTVINNEK